jgi:hypothetical protein
VPGSAYCGLPESVPATGTDVALISPWASGVVGLSGLPQSYGTFEVPLVAEACGFFRTLASQTELRQQDGRQDQDHEDHDQQLDEREGTVFVHRAHEFPKHSSPPRTSVHRGALLPWLIIGP